MLMKTPDDAEMLALWERGLARHPIDRALLLCAWARPDLPPARLPELPLGIINRALLRLREACFGSRISAWVDCEHCGERMEVTFDTGQLLAGVNEDSTSATHDNTPGELEISNHRFRLPCSRDLAAVSGERDIESAAVKLLENCCLAHPADTEAKFAGMLTEAETLMTQLDPAANINLALGCEECGKTWLADFNIGTLLWEEIDVRARTLLAEVHSLARAYGWSEAAILALSAQRRASYLDMVGI
jgi:hypothetical protein